MQSPRTGASAMFPPLPRRDQRSGFQILGFQTWKLESHSEKVTLRGGKQLVHHQAGAPIAQPETRQWGALMTEPRQEDPERFQVPWMVWLHWLGVVSQTEWSPVQFQSGHTPGLRSRSRLGACERQPYNVPFTHQCFSPFFSLSSPL